MKKANVILSLVALLVMSSFVFADPPGPTIIGTACTADSQCPSGQTCQACPSGATCGSARLCRPTTAGTVPVAVPTEEVNGRICNTEMPNEFEAFGIKVRVSAVTITGERVTADGKQPIDGSYLPANKVVVHGYTGTVAARNIQQVFWTALERGQTKNVGPFRVQLGEFTRSGRSGGIVCANVKIIREISRETSTSPVVCTGIGAESLGYPYVVSHAGKYIGINERMLRDNTVSGEGPKLPPNQLTIIGGTGTGSSYRTDFWGVWSIGETRTSSVGFDISLIDIFHPKEGQLICAKLQFTSPRRGTAAPRRGVRGVWARLTGRFFSLFEN